MRIKSTQSEHFSQKYATEQYHKRVKLRKKVHIWIHTLIVSTSLIILTSDSTQESIKQKEYQFLKENSLKRNKIPEISQQMEKIRGRAKRLYSPTQFEKWNNKGFQTLRYEDRREINKLPGAAEISDEIEQLEIDENYLGEEIITKNPENVKNLLNSFNKIKEEEKYK